MRVVRIGIVFYRIFLNFGLKLYSCDNNYICFNDIVSDIYNYNNLYFFENCLYLFSNGIR